MPNTKKTTGNGARSSNLSGGGRYDRAVEEGVNEARSETALAERGTSIEANGSQGASTLRATVNRSMMGIQRMRHPELHNSPEGIVLQSAPGRTEVRVSIGQAEPEQAESTDAKAKSKDSAEETEDAYTGILPSSVRKDLELANLQSMMGSVDLSLLKEAHEAAEGSAGLPWIEMGSFLRAQMLATPASDITPELIAFWIEQHCLFAKETSGRELTYVEVSTGLKSLSSES